MSQRRRRALLATTDAICWLVAVPLAALVRYDFEPNLNVLLLAFLVSLGCAVLTLALGSVFHLYRGRYVVASFDEVIGVVCIAAFVGVVASLTVLALPATSFPRSTMIIATGIAIIFMLGARFAWRNLRRANALGRQGSRTLIYGAGDSGSQIANLLLMDKSSGFQPVGYIDDDESKKQLRRNGLRVFGSFTELSEIAAEHGVETLLVAQRNVPANRLIEITHKCNLLGIQVRLIPTASEMATGAVKFGDLSDITEEDLMGRREIVTDESQIEHFVSGRRILVTGAGGSIGSEIVRQLSRYSPEALFLLDRDESSLHSVQLSLDGTGDLCRNELVLGDIRDREWIVAVFEEIKPDLVFHAAALKHLSMLERFPSEAFKTNVLGSATVLSAALRVGVRDFVNISTDKAADPTSVLGYSKLITERLTSGILPPAQGGAYVSVRFGNVLGSRGSVLHTFRYQIEHGGPVTVTDPEVTRFFMTVSEAVHLVLQAAVLGDHGETLVLDMGTPVKIADVARFMIERSGREIPIAFTGLRPGEKLHESLISSTESASRPKHALISHTVVRPLQLDSLPANVDSTQCRQVMMNLAQPSSTADELL